MYTRYEDEIEMWRPIHAAPGYEVSWHGRVRNSHSGKMIKPKDNNTGSLFVGLYVHGKRKSFTVGGLVATAFHHEKPDSRHVVHHFNGDYRDNHWTNVMWILRLISMEMKEDLERGVPLYNRKIRNLKTGQVYQNSREAALDLFTSEEAVRRAVSRGSYIGGQQVEYV